MATLQDLRVLDLGQGVAGPFCARLLGDCGADVIKIEAPRGGDSTRHNGEFSSDATLSDVSPLYVYLNQNKRGVSLDIFTATGRDLLKRLVEKADIVVESFPPGTLDRAGLAYHVLAAVNPGVVLVSITNFGQTGPYRNWPASHLTLSALGGWMHMTGDHEREPLQVGFPILYYVAGLFGATGALAAIQGRDKDGQGQHVDVSVMDVCLNLQYPKLVDSFGGPPPRRRIIFPMYVRAKDGWAAVNAISPQHWQSACLLMDMADVLADQELVYNILKRDQLRPQLEARANDWAKEKTCYEIFYAGQELRIPTGLPYTPAEMMECPQLLAREFFEKLSQPGLGEFMQPRSGFRSPSLRTERAQAPRLGEHNQEVFSSELGLEQEDMAGLRSAGVI